MSHNSKFSSHGNPNLSYVLLGRWEKSSPPPPLGQLKCQGRLLALQYYYKVQNRTVECLIPPQVKISASPLIIRQVASVLNGVKTTLFKQEKKILISMFFWRDVDGQRTMCWLEIGVWCWAVQPSTPFKLWVTDVWKYGKHCFYNKLWEFTFFLSYSLRTMYTCILS